MKRNAVLRILAAVPAAAGLIWFCIPFHWNVHNIGNLSGVTVCALVLFAALMYPAIGKLCSRSKPWKIAWRGLVAFFLAGIAWAGFLSCLMVSAMNSAPPEHATVIVLGSKVDGTVPSADLRVRLETAAGYLKANPQAGCIVSGGKGAGELVTEASVMKEYLAKLGIDPSRIVTEDRSKTTKENLAYSLAIIRKNNRSEDIAIVTDEYHQYRAGRIAQSLGMKPYAVCAATPWYIFSACWARELLALTKFMIAP